MAFVGRGINTLRTVGNQTAAGVKTFSSSPKVPTKAAGDSSTAAASTAFVDNAITAAINTLSGAVVHIAGAETITGEKTFGESLTINRSDGGGVYRFKDTRVTQGTPPDSGEYNYFVTATDKNNTNIGSLKIAYRYTGDGYVSLIANKHDGSTGSPSIGVYCDSSNNAYTSCPQPTDTTSTSSSQIATVGWVNTTGNNVAHLTGTETIGGTKTFSSAAYGTASDATNSIVTTVNKTKAANGYYQFGNGLIIQWGKFTASGNSQQDTITFPKSFTTTNASVTITRDANDWSTGVPMQVQSISKTNFKSRVDAGTVHWLAIGY